MEGMADRGPILVAGGSGFIGRAVVRRLVGEGLDVAAMTAHPSRSAARIQGMGARVVRGDVLDAATLPAAVAGMTAVVQALTFPTFPVQVPRKRFTFDEFDHLGTARLVTAAAAAGVGRFVFVSGSGAAPDAATTWHRAKWAGEEAVRATGIDHVIVRPSWVYGPEDRALNAFVAFHRALPVVPVVGDGRQRLQPVFVDDVAAVVSRGVAPDGPTGTFEVGGPDVLSMDQVLGVMMDVRSHRKPLVHVPVWMAKLGGALARSLPNPRLSPQAVDFLTGDALADTGPLLKTFDVRLTVFRDGLRTYLAPRP
jgi:NADH dehydrogenase